jgi:hypothetical protein
VVAEKAKRDETGLRGYKIDATHRDQLSKEAVESIKIIVAELVDKILLDAPNTTVKQNGNATRLVLGDIYLEYQIEFPEMPRHETPYQIGRRIGSRYWDVLCSAYLSIYSLNGTKRSRSANLWFGSLIEGEGYKWWEVCYAEDGEATVPTPFGLWDLYSSELSYCVAEDPQPITPDCVVDFLDRWIELFARAASLPNWELDTLFPANYIRPSIADKFRLDKR